MIFDELIIHLEKTRGLHLLREKTDNVSNKLYLLSKDEIAPQFVLKGLQPDSFEIKAYSQYLPKIKESLKTLVIPQLVEKYQGEKLVYLLIPYYQGDTFDFNTSDINLADNLFAIVQDLYSIKVEKVISGGGNFDIKDFEGKFWEYFEKALALELITESLREKCLSVLNSGKTNQKMVISNGDFNPRNVIRLSNGQLVLIDWDGIVSPLEHLLTYPWLLNWQNPAWQKRYASQFERGLPVKNERIRMHLMSISLLRAVDEKGHHNQFADHMAQNHIKNFKASLEELESLTEICG